jgi:hypothetical protein
MFTHIVLMKFTPQADAHFHARVQEYAVRLRRELAYVKAWDLVPNVASRAQGFSHAVIATFASSADHDRYQDSPVHQEMKKFMTPYFADLIACDYEAD